MKKMSFASFYKKFEKNEDNNLHSENAILLAERYGNKKDILEAKKIYKLHMERMSLTPDLYERRRKIETKLFPLMYKEEKNTKKRRKRTVKRKQAKNASNVGFLF